MPRNTTADDGRTGTSRTRRRLLGATAAGLVAGLAGCAGGDDATPTDEPMESPTDEPTESPTDESTDTEGSMAAPDVPVLNYALTLEHLENAFYREGLETFADAELREADVLSPFGEELRRQVPSYLETVGAHEAAHVDALAATVEELGGEPVAEGTYEFGYETASEFLGVAQALENTGVAAYTGAAPNVVNEEVLTAAAGIQSVEARHASFLNLLNGDSPFPSGVEEASSVSEVLETAGGFVTSEVDPGVYELADDRPAQSRKTDDETTDVEVLNYALTLEHLENAFYREGLERFDDDQLRNADALSAFDDGIRNGLPDQLRTVGAHEAAHVDAIAATIEESGGTPVEEAEYDFGYETPSEFLGVARALENTGVSAYAGAAPTVSNDEVFSAAVGIHGVEARHAALLNGVNGEIPFPDGVDQPRTMAEVREIAGQFIVS